MTHKFLPVGIQNFEKMITGNFLYVDKTRYLYEMAGPIQGFYFPARPRRFGKSLMVSTLAALFSGRRDLFSWLWIENTDWDWQPHPVIEIDFNEKDPLRPLEIPKSNRRSKLDEGRTLLGLINAF